MVHKHTLPVFDRAVDSFDLFLKDQGHSGDLRWIFREDITWHDERFFVKLPLPRENALLVARLYERGCERGLGISIEMFCFLNSEPCCYIWVPETEREAELALVTGLKLGAPSNPQTAEPVFTDREWQNHELLGKASGAEMWLDQLPTRSGLLSSR